MAKSSTGNKGVISDNFNVYGPVAIGDNAQARQEIAASNINDILHEIGNFRHTLKTSGLPQEVAGNISAEVTELEKEAKQPASRSSQLTGHIDSLSKMVKSAGDLGENTTSLLNSLGKISALVVAGIGILGI